MREGSGWTDIGVSKFYGECGVELLGGRAIGKRCADCWYVVVGGLEMWVLARGVDMSTSRWTKTKREINFGVHDIQHHNLCTPYITLLKIKFVRMSRFSESVDVSMGYSCSRHRKPPLPTTGPGTFIDGCDPPHATVVAFRAVRVYHRTR